MDYTSAQKAAIMGQFNGSVLVSASAGSGKTRVLVDRVINQLLHFKSIDQLLIVTFTRAAAKEMQTRILTALQAQVHTTDDQRLKHHLYRQIRKLPVADISTLDAFCQKIVQRYYYVTGIDPNFRILSDPTELGMLRDQVWEQVREGEYVNPEFERLTETFSDDRSDDGLTELVYQLYDYANVNQDPQGWLAKLPQLYVVGDSLTDSDFYQRALMPRLINRLDQILINCKTALTVAKENELVKEKECLSADVDNLSNLKQALMDQSWDSLFNQMRQFKWPRFPAGPRGKNADPAVKAVHDHVKDLRDAGKDQFAKLAGYFIQDEEQNLRVMKKAAKLVQNLVMVVNRFSVAYQALKRQRHVMEFIDIEHEASQILAGREGPNNIRAALQAQYQEIMVDEYQDNNRLQDAILQQIAQVDPHDGAQNLFMVGDVKQSIYRFRLAAPQLFLDRMKNYSLADNEHQVIRLRENFRSLPNVDHFINLIFNQIMSQTVGKIEYQGANNLVAGARDYPADFVPNVEVLIYRNQAQPKHLAAAPSASIADQEAMNERFEVADRARGQMELIAQKILKMINSPEQQVFDRQTGQLRAVQYSDIALISATRNNNLVIADVFAQYGIPVTINGTQSYFKTTEIRIMMALLSIIDNPYQDIPLVAVLRSPIVGLNENQLAYLRINAQTGDYYQAVKHFVFRYPKDEHSEAGDQIFEKVQLFLEQLTHFRDVAQQKELVQLIWTIYEETGFLDYVGGMPAGKQRQANLHALYDRAAQYEQSSFKGLFQFVRFIERMQNGDNDLAEPAINNAADTVSVMTIHGSKGLEFPIVFLMDANHQFNLQDSRGSFVLDDQLGVGITSFDPVKREEQVTLQKLVVQDQLNMATLDEEMRKLYVGLTRAEQYLLIVGTVNQAKQTDEQLLEDWGHKAAQSEQQLLAPALRSDAKSYLDWILPALARHPKLQAQFNDTVPLQSLDADKVHLALQFYHPEELFKHAPKAVTANTDHIMQALNQAPAEPVAAAAEIQALMDYQYPNQAATTTTAYQAVSEIKRVFDDPDAVQMGQLTGLGTDVKQANRYVTSDFATPAFLQTLTQPKPTEVGTATHLVLQKISLAKMPTEVTLNELIEQLVADQLITAPVAEQINRQSILRFFASDVGSLILKHPQQFHREVPFSLIIDANQIFTGFQAAAHEKVLVHGIIDGYLVLDDEVILLDYKTDYVGQHNPTQWITKLLEKYRGQVNLYGLALTKILGRPVEQRYLYLLSINQLVPVHSV